MRFYKANKRVSYALMVFSVVSVGSWIALVILHLVNNQGINIYANALFQEGYNACRGNFTNSAYGGLPYNTHSAGPVPPYGTLLVQNHANYQFISIMLLFGSGPSEFIVLILSFFLFLKSKVPYKAKWYLSRVKHLKLAIYILSWLGLTCTTVYFGYTFTFYLKLGTRDCTHTSLRSYADGYFANSIIGAIMTLASLLNYFVAIGIRPEPLNMPDGLFAEEQSKGILQPLNTSPEAQRAFAQQLANIPKYGQGEIQMFEPPKGFQTEYISEQKRQGTYNQYQNYHDQALLPSFGQKAHLQVPETQQPLASNPIGVNYEDRFKQYGWPTQERSDPRQRILGQAYVSPVRPTYEHQKSWSPVPKERLKVFNRGVTASKQRTIISDLRSRYGHN